MKIYKSYKISFNRPESSGAKNAEITEANFLSETVGRGLCTKREALGMLRRGGRLQTSHAVFWGETDE